MTRCVKHFPYADFVSSYYFVAYQVHLSMVRDVLFHWETEKNEKETHGQQRVRHSKIKLGRIIKGGRKTEKETQRQRQREKGREW